MIHTPRMLLIYLTLAALFAVMLSPLFIWYGGGLWLFVRMCKNFHFGNKTRAMFQFVTFTLWGCATYVLYSNYGADYDTFEPEIKPYLSMIAVCMVMWACWEFWDRTTGSSKSKGLDDPVQRVDVYTHIHTDRWTQDYRTMSDDY